MARFIVTDSSYFTPFTYDELARPVQNMQTAHNVAQEVYDTVGTEASALGRYITDNPGDRNAKALYDNYMDKLKTLQDNLWENGYTGRTRHDLSAARQGYASDIARLSAAIKARQERSAEWAKRRNDNPNLVTAADPGLSGLDSYLGDDNYGRSWWSYDSANFEKEVGAEAKARAGELLNNPRVVKVPRLKAILTRIYGTGFTNAEVNDAAAAVRAIAGAGLAGGGIPDQASRHEIYSRIGLGEPSQLLAEALFNRYEATGAPGSGADASELRRLIDRGIAGFAYGIGEQNVKDFTDPDFSLQQQKDLIDYRNSRKAVTDSGTPDTASDRSIQFKDTDTANPGGARMQRRLRRQLGMKDGTVLTTKDGEHTVHNGPEAAALVYSDDLARRTAEAIGFDFRRSGNPARTSGFIRGKSGTVYQTTYMPEANDGKGGVAYRPYSDGTAGLSWRQSLKNGDAKVSRKLTDIYNEAMDEYNGTLSYYRSNEPEIYRLAGKIDPKEQEKKYRKYGYDASTPVTEFAGSMLGNPDFSRVTDRDEGWIARKGTDKGGYADMLTGMLLDKVNLKPGSDKRLEKHREWKRAGKDNTLYIHRLNEYGGMERKGVKNPNDVLRVKDGKIVNVSGYRLSADGIKNHYLIVSTDDSRTDYAVSTDMFGDSAIDAMLDREYNEAILPIIENPYLSDSDRDEMIHDEVEATIRDILTHLTSSVSKADSGTLGKGQGYLPMPPDEGYDDYGGYDSDEYVVD